MCRNCKFDQRIVPKDSYINNSQYQNTVYIEAYTKTPRQSDNYRGVYYIQEAIKLPVEDLLEVVCLWVFDTEGANCIVVLFSHVVSDVLIVVL